MKGIYLMGRFGSGKTAICVGMALKLREEGYRVGYFKPVGSVPTETGKEDEDVVLMKHICKTQDARVGEVLFNVGPQYLTRYDGSENYLAKVVAAFNDVAKSVDVVIVEGTTQPYAMMSLGIDSPSIARETKGRVLVVATVENDYSLDNVMLMNEFCKSRGTDVIGTIFNNVPRPLLGKVQGVYKPLMEKKGYPVVGIIPENFEIADPTVKEFVDVLGGEVLTGQERLDLLVEDVLIGAMTLEGALSYMRRAPNKAFITGGDRSDLALAALETSTSCLILTGGLYPDVKVIAKASEKGVPVILVHDDTYTAVEKLHEVSRKIKPRDDKVIALAKNNFETFCDWNRIKAEIGL